MAMVLEAFTHWTLQLFNDDDDDDDDHDGRVLKSFLIDQSLVVIPTILV